tara:strand:- start:32 stop:280 length:249 start_codon:yes stop_codon:yes gene_type:complete
MIKQLIEQFWGRVRTYDPADITSSEIKLVSDSDVNFLIKELLQEQVKEYEGLNVMVHDLIKLQNLRISAKTLNVEVMITNER